MKIKIGNRKYVTEVGMPGGKDSGKTSLNHTFY